MTNTLQELAHIHSGTLRSLSEKLSKAVNVGGVVYVTQKLTDIVKVLNTQIIKEPNE